jgi:hypothetical protein
VDIHHYHFSNLSIPILSQRISSWLK